MKFNNLNKYRVGGTDSKMELAIRPPSTPAGRIYRMSPNEHAHPRHFVIGNVTPEFQITGEARARMKLEPRSKQTVCPYSGVIAPDTSFLHPDDEKAILDTVKQAALEDVRAAFSDMFKGLASRSKRITYKAVPRAPKPRLVFHRDDLLRELVCDHCGRDYGVYAIGLFCPDCGAPNLRLHFERERQLVNAQVEIAEAQDEGLAELAYRLLGNAHEDVLTAFEATLKTVYLFGIAKRAEGAPAVKPVGNDFQNLERAEKRFKDLAFDPFAGLGEEDLSTLRLNIQKRHIIGHNLGVVDSKFAEHAEEARLGETVQLVGDDVRHFAAICQRVVDALDEWLCGAPSPTIGISEIEGETPAASKSKKQMTLDDVALDVSPLVKEIALWMAKQSMNGLPYLENGSDLIAAFPEASHRELSRAIAELESEGLATLAGGIGREVPQPFPTTDLYAVFDPVACGTDPHIDACDLIRRVLEKAKAENSVSYGVSAPELLAETGWTHRRLNPAVALMIAQVDDRRVSKSLDGEFAARSFHIMADDELALERFLKRMGR
jgi:hypothetical protein